MNALRAIAFAVATLALVPASALGGDAGSAAALRAHFAELADKLRYNQFRRPLHLDSREVPEGVSGEIHAYVDQPFSVVGPALGESSAWCEILLLHLNTKSCKRSGAAQETVLHVRIGRKFDQPEDEAYKVDFVHQLAARDAGYLKVVLSSAQGPLGTHDYRIVLEAAPDGARTMVHMSYAYAFGALGRMAMNGYLGTAGRDKVGFSLAAKDGGGAPKLVGGMRGVVERNTMRYYLAIESFLGAQAVPPTARREKSMGDWFAAVERYPRQLHEMERKEYLDMKRKEYAR